MSSVVIPAHDEAKSIPRLLAELAPLADETEIVIVCNGCSDDTADAAQVAAPWAEIVEIAEASKPAALDAGDATASTFPRAYIDADICISADSVRRLFEVLGNGTLAVAASPAHDLSDSSWLVRAHYAIWSRMNDGTREIHGTGAMVLSGEGRARFTSWPRVIGDDYFLDGQFCETEKCRVPGAVAISDGPRTVWDCVSRRARVHQGNIDVRELGLRGPHSRRGLRAVAAVVRSQPALAICIPPHLLVVGAGRVLARRRRRMGTSKVWYRDRGRETGHTRASGRTARRR
jgi:glycosyltransferase involved in cell wall biosynthesis